jgi:hypothetical protein
MECVICENKIKEEPSGWSKGNNALPFKQGRCCDVCNLRFVIPYRVHISLKF